MSIHKRTFAILAAVSAAAVMLGAPAARADDLDHILAAKKIRIGVDLSIPPYGMVDDKLQQTGSEIECAKLLASDLGVALEIVPLTGANRVPFLLTNKVDVVMASFGITPERKKVVAFSKPYSVTPSAVGVPERIKVSTMADLAGKKVGVTRGTVNDQLLTARAPAGTQIMRFEDDSASTTAILSGQVDAFATAPPLLFALNKKDPSIKLRAAIVLEYFRIGAGVRQADTKLRDRIDHWVDVNMQNGKLPAIYKKYFDAPLPMDQLTKQ
jgi:polar amino acid transport system substrate-binding protein